MDEEMVMALFGESFKSEDNFGISIIITEEGMQ